MLNFRHSTSFRGGHRRNDSIASCTFANLRQGGKAAKESLTMPFLTDSGSGGESRGSD